ncbi:MAG: hypothetical protein ABS920_04735, partial [Sporosarcina sp.]
SKVYGNVFRTNIVDFWYNNKDLNLIRTLLYNKLRIVYPCNKCDYYGGGRVGFLPKYKTIPQEKVEKLKEKYADYQIDVQARKNGETFAQKTME